MDDWEQAIDQRLDIYRRIAAQAAIDPGFRTALKSDPVAALKSGLGIDWDPAVFLDVIEETPERVVLVLPARAANDDELSDGDLDQVAAGSTPTRHDTATMAGLKIG